MNEVTRILSAIQHGDGQAPAQLLPLVYQELRELAAERFRHEKPGYSMQATALVHEAYLRLVDRDQPQQFNGRGHFFAAAAEAMRRILVERARRRQRMRHGGGQQRVDLDHLDAAQLTPEQEVDVADELGLAEQLLALDEALARLAAHQPQSADERLAYLVQACRGDARVRRAVDTLLSAHVAAGDFLEAPPASAAVAANVPLDPPTLFLPAGTVIDRYKLLESIGEGGYGVVFMAEQTSPVQRKVALKIIKAGMDTRQVIARFEAERQALALMDHPNIAKVFDAGTTDTGRPYFVMELVKGVPITKYCDEHHVEPRQRLELFMRVCQAVQHAHQKGIIHRDLKPSNILIALYDGKPVPKVIDFGVAKATQQKLTERTMFTEVGQIVGTLEYMAPEQAELNNLDIDTRADIYSLGVLLYELLTGE